MQVQKRDGTIVPFDPTKIRDAVLATFAEVDGEITSYARNKANVIASDIQNSCEDEEFLEVEDIQDEVINRLMASQRKDVARAYVEYRYKKYLLRQYNTTDKSILELLDGTNEYWNKENSNKNATLATTQRDYLAGITSTDISMRLILPEDVVKAHKEGIIHFHDADYFLQHMHNCDLINLDDMLHNGTVISGVMIEKPHSFSTACNIATQAVAQVASSQYGF